MSIHGDVSESLITARYPNRERDWSEDFFAIHGRKATQNDVEDRNWSEAYAQHRGKTPTRDDWKRHYDRLSRREQGERKQEQIEAGGHWGEGGDFVAREESKINRGTEAYPSWVVPMPWEAKVDYGDENSVWSQYYRWDAARTGKKRNSRDWNIHTTKMNQLITRNAGWEYNFAPEYRDFVLQLAASRTPEDRVYELNKWRKDMAAKGINVFMPGPFNIGYIPDGAGAAKPGMVKVKEKPDEVVEELVAPSKPVERKSGERSEDEMAIEHALPTDKAVKARDKALKDEAAGTPLEPSGGFFGGDGLYTPPLTEKVEDMVATEGTSGIGDWQRWQALLNAAKNYDLGVATNVEKDRLSGAQLIAPRSDPPLKPVDDQVIGELPAWTVGGGVPAVHGSPEERALEEQGARMLPADRPLTGLPPLDQIRMPASRSPEERALEEYARMLPAPSDALGELMRLLPKLPSLEELLGLLVPYYDAMELDEASRRGGSGIGDWQREQGREDREREGVRPGTRPGQPGRQNPAFPGQREYLEEQQRQLVGR